jgi:hypothetical protein
VTLIRGNDRIILGDPDIRWEDCPIEFRLTYEGCLKGSSNDKPRSDHKHLIRTKFHPQLKRLWEVNSWLSDLKSLNFPSYDEAVRGNALKNEYWNNKTPYLDLLGANYQAHDRRWAPLLGENMGLTCMVHVLFLRQGSRGGVLNVGDIDGRLKTLFDALAIPRGGSGLPHPETDQPIFVLLSDDRHISHASVETDELLEPTSLEAGQNDSRVIITVNIRPLRANYFTLGFSGL